MAEQSFPTADVLTVVTGRMVSEGGLGGVYAVLNWMTGENLFTHQLPRVSREAQAFLVGGMPSLAEAAEEARQITPENWRGWLMVWIDRYGPTINVPKFTTDAHEYREPMSEAAEHFHPDNIAVVEI